MYNTEGFVFIVDAPILCASFYVERIDLASKLRKCKPKWRWNRPFSGKSPLTNFQTLTHQISLFAGLHTLSNPFHEKTKKQTYSTTLKTFSLYFKFQLNRDELPLTTIVCYPTEENKSLLRHILISSDKWNSFVCKSCWIFV